MLVDAPPILPHAEGPAVLRALERTALAVAAEATRETTLQRALALLDHQDVALACTILKRPR